QHALARRDFPAAEALLREALARDPDYAHVHMYLAHALAEQERLAEAEAALARALALAPGIFVFPLHLGIVRLDAGDTGGARLALESAARLAADNPLVAGYLDLVAWGDAGPRDALAALGGAACGREGGDGGAGARRAGAAPCAAAPSLRVRKRTRRSRRRVPDAAGVAGGVRGGRLAVVGDAGGRGRGAAAGRARRRAGRLRERP